MTDFDPFDETWPETAEDGPGRDEAEQAADLHARLVREELRRLRAQRDARAILAAEGRTRDPFDAGTLAEVLGRPEDPAARVESLIPWQASTLVVAQRKTGKTTWSLNLARCLVTGEPFLGSMDVRPIAADAKVGLLNFEVSAAQLARWAHECGVPAERLYLVNLRGRRNPLTDAEDRANLAGLLRAQRVESLIVDPFGRAYSGESQNDAGQVGSWLIALDEFARTDVGALDVILTAHAGWNGERSRGSSALEDWADAVITLTRDEDTGERFMRAIGRDVDLGEDRLDFDPVTRLLRLSGDGSRRDGVAARHLADLVQAVLAIVAKDGPLNGTQVAQRLRAADVPHQKGEHVKALRQAVEDGTLRVEAGHRGAKVYHRNTPPTPTYPDLPQGVALTYPDPTYIGGVGQGVPETSTYPRAVGRVCADCGEPVSAGRVRCPSCITSMNRGVR